jgi:hypothetical protein
MRRVLPVGSVSAFAIGVAKKRRRHAARVAAGVAFLPPATACRCAIPDGLFIRRARTVVCERCHLVVPIEGSC